MTSTPSVVAKNAAAATEAGTIFRCVACRQHGLQARADAFRCEGCDTDYPVVLGVPLLLKGLGVSPSGFSLPTDAVAPISDLLHEPRSEEWARFLREVFSYRYEFADVTLSAENNYFFNRIGLPRDLMRPPLQTEAPVNVDVRYAIEHHLVGAALPCGRVQTRNVRLRNTGAAVISSRGPRAVVISYQWRDAGGRPLACAQATTPLPVDLQPGRALTVPTLIHTPPKSGACFLELMLHQTGVGRLDRDSHLAGVQLVPPSPHPARPHWKRTNLPPETYDYLADHRLGQEIVLREIERASRGARLRILEVGGCCEPWLRNLPHEVYNTDIDVQTLQIGAYRRRNDAHPIAHVAADANDLPFAEQTFDAIALFAVLHHLPDPGRALAHLKRFLKPGGFLALMCEPVGHYENGVVSEEFHAELLHGINEQIFTEEEYEEMFLRAGLVQGEVTVDRGSLKAILRPRDPRAGSTLTLPQADEPPGGLVRRLRRWLRRRAA